MFETLAVKLYNELNAAGQQETVARRVTDTSCSVSHAANTGRIKPSKKTSGSLLPVVKLASVCWSCLIRILFIVVYICPG